MCGQGPYELEIPVAGAKWGEEFELRLHAPHRVEVQAVVLAYESGLVTPGRPATEP